MSGLETSELPLNNWKVKTFGEVCLKIQDGAHHSPKNQFPERRDGLFPYITSKNIRHDYLDLSSVTYVDEEFHSTIYPRCTPELGDVLLTKDGANTGNVTLNTLDEPFSLLSSVCLIKPDRTQILPAFLKYYIQSETGTEQITGKMTGAAIKRIILKTIKAASVPVPPLPEQERIVAILDEAFGGIATATAHAERNLHNARELFQSVLQSTFEQKGEDWVETTLGNCGKTQTGSTPKKANPEHFGKHVPFIKPGDFNEDGTLDYENQGLSMSGLSVSRPIPAYSAIMVCIGATIGKSGFCVQPITTNQQINALIPNSGLDAKFAYYQFVTSGFQRLVVGNAGQATLPIISKSKWGNLPFQVPPLDEQKAIVQKLDALAAETRRLEAVYQRKLDALAELKQSLLQRAFAGEL